MRAIALQKLQSFCAIAEVAVNIAAMFVVLGHLLGVLSITLMSSNERSREVVILRSVSRLSYMLQSPLANSLGFYLEINMLSSNG